MDSINKVDQVISLPMVRPVSAKFLLQTVLFKIMTDCWQKHAENRQKDTKVKNVKHRAMQRRAAEDQARLVQAKYSLQFRV